MSGIAEPDFLICLLSGPADRVLAAVVDDVRAGALDLGDDRGEVLGVRVHVLFTGDSAAELGELGLEGGGQTGAVGLLVVDDEDLLLLGVVEQVLRGERTLDGVRRRGAEVRLVRASLLAAVPLRTLGQGRVGVRGRDLGQLRVVEDLLHGLGHRGVQRADDTEDVLVGDELGGVLLSGGRLGLVVEGFHLEGDAVDVLLGVGLLGREVDRVLDAETQSGELTGQRGIDADDDRGTAALGPTVLVVARATGGERQGSRGERSRDGY